MARTRLILGALMSLLMAGGFAIHESGMEEVLKAAAGIADAFLFLSAAILMGVTFFVLDSQGRIPHGSLAWRFFSRFYGEHMPERLKLCPAYWMIVLGLTGCSIASAIAVVVVWLIGLVLVYGPPTNSDAKAFLTALGIMAALAAIVAGVSRLLCKFEKYLLLKIWWSFVAFLVVGGITALFMASFMRQGMSAGQATVAVGIGLGKFILFLVSAVALIVGLVAALVGIVYVASRVLPWVANSIIGLLVAALYRGLCPVIQVAPAPVPAQAEPQPQ